VIDDRKGKKRKRKGRKKKEKGRGRKRTPTAFWTNRTLLQRTTQIKTLLPTVNSKATKFSAVVSSSVKKIVKSHGFKNVIMHIAQLSINCSVGLTFKPKYPKQTTDPSEEL